jgi:phosphoketolase
MKHKELLDEWALGYGVIQHHPNTQVWVKKIIDSLVQKGQDQKYLINLFIAADRIASAAMWLVVHETYANRINLQGTPLETNDFKLNPQGHTGGSLNMVVAYVGYMLANAISGKTRGWVMGQGHCVSAIDSVNLLLNNMRMEHAQRYNVSDEGLTRYVTDFYSYRLNEHGLQDSPLGSHVNINTAGGCLEGGYLGFADLYYIHMALPEERLVAFLSDGAFEEQRGSDWAPQWWRQEDSGLIVPIMIFNGRRIDQRSMISQGRGLKRFVQHLKSYDFDPIVFDGTDPAAFACMILEGEQLLQDRSQKILTGKMSYPISLPYGVAVAKKGAGFYGEGTNAAHSLPLGANPHFDDEARRNFNRCAKKLHVPLIELQNARTLLQNHTQSSRPLERDNSIANRRATIEHYPSLTFHEINAELVTYNCPMSAIDETFMAYVHANPLLRPRVGNPDELLSNHMVKTLSHLKHRVTETESGVSEAIDGKIITALNEEAVACACLANKSGINLIVTYEAFAPKMLGALRQEIIWSDHLLSQNREPGWISIPLILTSHTYENGKNERSHQDTTLCEVLLGEPSGVSRVLFPADYNTAIASLDYCYQTRGKIVTLVASKEKTNPDLFSELEARLLIKNGIIRINLPHSNDKPHIILTAIGSYQFHQVMHAATRLHRHNIKVAINYLIDPSRFREPRGKNEADFQTFDALKKEYFPPGIPARVFVCHTRPHVMSGILRPLDTGRATIFLGFINQGGTLDSDGMLFVNQQSWAHIVLACAMSLAIDPAQLLYPLELKALSGEVGPQGVIFLD